MDKTRRGAWAGDGLLVAVFLGLIAATVPYLREFHRAIPMPGGMYGPLNRMIIPPGGYLIQSDYHANTWQRSLPALCTIVLLPLVRRRPLVFATVASIGQVLLAMVHSPGDSRYTMLIAADACLVAIALAWPRRTSLKAALLIMAGGMVSITAFPPGDPQLLATHLVVITLMTLVSWLLGSSTRERRAGVVRQRADAAVQAVANERLRIARELHDMIAHSIGIIAIQAGMGNRVIGTQPAEAQKALRAIEETSRDTLSQLRRTLTALRHGDSAATPTDPAPGLDDLDKLVASTKHAGVLAIVEKVGMPRPLPGEIDLAAYRIIQESVTNVVRHSGARTCRVRIEYRDTAVAVTVTDDGHGVLGSGGTGFGLVGMRERVSLVHGTFSAGPRVGGGFLVSTTLPVPGGFETVYGSGGAHAGDDAAAAAADIQDADADQIQDTEVTGVPDTADSDSDPQSDPQLNPQPDPQPGAVPVPDPNPAVTS